MPSDIPCPTCGEPDPRVTAPSTRELRDEGLLDQVGVALSRQSELARSVAAQRVESTSHLLAEMIVLRGRLRRQASTLRHRVAEEKELVPRLSGALGRVDHALGRADRRDPTGDDWRMSARLPRDRSCATIARRLLEEYAREELGEREGEDAMLIASELATNAFLHGSGEIVLSVRRAQDCLRIEVHDDGHPHHIAVRPERERVDGGRGLWIVDQLARDWGAPAGTGHVWAEVTLESRATDGR